jgi:hypothetical protein
MSTTMRATGCVAGNIRVGTLLGRLVLNPRRQIEGWQLNIVSPCATRIRGWLAHSRPIGRLRARDSLAQRVNLSDGLRVG